MVTTPAVAVGLQLGLALVGLLLAGSRSRYTRAGVVLAALALLAPVLVPAEMPLLRGVLSLISWLGFLRAVDLARDERRWPPWRRIWLGVSYFDAREAVRVGARLDGWQLVRTVGFGALAVASYALATWSDGGALARYGGGLVFLYASADGFHAASRLFWRAVGFEIEPFHRDPILSRTVGEFWGRGGTSSCTIGCGTTFSRRCAAAAGLCSAPLRRSWSAPRSMSGSS